MFIDKKAYRTDGVTKDFFDRVDCPVYDLVGIHVLSLDSKKLELHFLSSNTREFKK